MISVTPQQGEKVAHLFSSWRFHPAFKFYFQCKILSEKKVPVSHTHLSYVPQNADDDEAEDVTDSVSSIVQYKKLYSHNGSVT